MVKTASTDAELARASEVILEILRAAKPSSLSKPKLHKAFYASHLNYARDNADVLSNWPILRMPHGLGIDRLAFLIEEIRPKIEVVAEREGPYNAMKIRLAIDEPSTLDMARRRAILEAVKWVTESSAAELSEQTLENSRSWQNAKDGDELDIYVDLESDEEFELRQKQLDQIAAAAESVLGK